MEDLDEFSTFDSHRHQQQKQLGLGLTHLSANHAPSFAQDSQISKSPQPSKNYSLERLTVSPNYSSNLLDPKDLTRQEVDELALALDLSNVSHSQARDPNVGPGVCPSPTLLSTARAMAPHGRPKLKRAAREEELQNATRSLLTHQCPDSPAPQTNESAVVSHMHRLKLKRGLRESNLQNLSRSTPNPPNSPLHQCLSSPASPTNDNQLALTSADNPRDKLPNSNHIIDPSSSLTCLEATSNKAPPKDERGSPDPNCAICLGKLRNKSFTDSCLHQFCFKCLVQWSKVKPECPLCKQGFKSIIHNVRSNEDYDQYHCQPAQQPSRCQDSLINELLDLPSLARFRYRTTLADHSHRLSPLANGAFQDVYHQTQYVLPSGSRWPSRPRRQVATAEFRASVYNRDLWVEDLPDFTGRFRECSPEFYSANPAQLHRLVPWLNREIPCAISDSHAPTNMIMDIILSLVSRFSIQSTTFRNHLRPYFGMHTNHFLHEFLAFARSPYDMIGFDQTANYGPDPTPSIYTAPSADSPHSSGNDSDVICLEPDEPPIAGPSGMRTQGISFTVVPSNSSGPTNTAVSGSSTQPAPLLADDSDDCAIVDYIKPRHERTPEIIVLSDSDEEMPNYESPFNQRGILNRLHNNDCIMYRGISELMFSSHPSRSSTPLSSSSSSSDTEYVPYSHDPIGGSYKIKKSARKKGPSARSKMRDLQWEAALAEVRKPDSDSDDSDASMYNLNSPKENKLLRAAKSAKIISRKRKYMHVPSPTPCRTQSVRTDIPGTSGFLPRQFCSDDSLEGHSSVVIPFLEGESNKTSDRPPVAGTSRRRHLSSSAGRDARPYGREHSSQKFDSTKRTSSKPTTSTWCIKPSSSDNAEITDGNATTPSSSGSENPPRLRSIVIMRNPNDRGKRRVAPGSFNRPTCKERSQSPVASTSRSVVLRSPSATFHSRRRLRSPSSEEHCSQSSVQSSLRGKASKQKYKPKSSKKECKRKSRKTSDPRSMESNSKKSRLSSQHRTTDSESSS